MFELGFFALTDGSRNGRHSIGFTTLTLGRQIAIRASAADEAKTIATVANGMMPSL